MAEAIQNIVLRSFRKCWRIKFHCCWLKCLECREKFDYRLIFSERDKDQMGTALCCYMVTISDTNSMKIYHIGWRRLSSVPPTLTLITPE